MLPTVSTNLIWRACVTQVGVVGALSAFYRDAADVNDPEQRDMAVLRIVSKMPTLAAIAYKTAIGASCHTTHLAHPPIRAGALPCGDIMQTHHLVVSSGAGQPIM